MASTQSCAENAKSILLDDVIRISREAGDAIMAYYETASVPTEKKGDGSPLTAADTAAHRLITERLKLVSPGVPIISEEGVIPDYEQRKGWERFWLIDPLDGTKEFLQRNGEFTVNVALIERGEPVLGVVFAPAKQLLYFAGKNLGAWRQEGAASPERVYSKEPRLEGPLVIVESRSHPSSETEEYLRALDVRQRVKVGSSLKFCVVAEGKADLYPRLGPTMEWDVAAGDCVYRNSAPQGFRKTTLHYNQPALRCTGFVIGAPDRA